MLSKTLSCLDSSSRALLNFLWVCQNRSEITWTNGKSGNLEFADDNRLINKSAGDMRHRTDSLAKSAKHIFILLINHWYSLDSTQSRIPTDRKGEAKITTLTLKELVDRITSITSEDRKINRILLYLYQHYQ